MTVEYRTRSGKVVPFHEFAMNHGYHHHCAECGCCILDPQATPFPIVWCVMCMDKPIPSSEIYRFNFQTQRIEIRVD